jgi:hypothetical protein
MMVVNPLKINEKNYGEKEMGGAIAYGFCNYALIGRGSIAQTQCLWPYAAFQESARKTPFAA